MDGNGDAGEEDTAQGRLCRRLLPLLRLLLSIAPPPPLVCCNSDWPPVGRLWSPDLCSAPPAYACSTELLGSTGVNTDLT